MTGDDIAVVGVAGRFPGADDIEAYEQNLFDGLDCTGKPVTGVEEFDAEFFGFDADEAARTDPQHRLFLETAYLALEDAGALPVGDTPAGVFASASQNQYLFCNLIPAGLANPPYQLPDYMPAQAAYRLGLTGPAVAVQTACSGSLVAVCLAAQNLTDFRCDLAIAGGTNVALPHFPYDRSLLSPDGICRAFDAMGEGSAFATGVGAVVLRRLEDAETNGDRIHAVLRGWGVTNDGAGRAGFAAPGIDGQAAAAAEALAVADLEPDAVGMVEAHGSGTVLGDAIEVAALSRAYGAATHPIALGSVKTNIGNLDAAAGIAGLLKAVVAVRRGRIPASLHFSSPNPQVDFGPFDVPTEAKPWPVDGPRIAGVHAYGLGGTNAHILVSSHDSRIEGTPEPAAGRHRHGFRRRRHWIDPPGRAS